MQHESSAYQVVEDYLEGLGTVTIAGLRLIYARRISYKFGNDDNVGWEL